MAKVPSHGVCIDRQDWIGVTNPNADDRRTWLPIPTAAGRGGQDQGMRFMPVRAMISSWKPAMKAFAAIWHSGGQAVIINECALLPPARLLHY